MDLDVSIAKPRHTDSHPGRGGEGGGEGRGGEERRGFLKCKPIIYIPWLYSAAYFQAVAWRLGQSQYSLSLHSKQKIFCNPHWFGSRFSMPSQEFIVTDILKLTSSPSVAAQPPLSVGLDVKEREATY